MSRERRPAAERERRGAGTGKADEAPRSSAGRMGKAGVARGLCPRRLRPTYVCQAHWSSATPAKAANSVPERPPTPSPPRPSFSLPAASRARGRPPSTSRPRSLPLLAGRAARAPARRHAWEVCACPGGVGAGNVRAGRAGGRNRKKGGMGRRRAGRGMAMRNSALPARPRSAFRPPPVRFPPAPAKTVCFGRAGWRGWRGVCLCAPQRWSWLRAASSTPTSCNTPSPRSPPTGSHRRWRWRWRAAGSIDPSTTS